jgi:hypothetical protein
VIVLIYPADPAEATAQNRQMTAGRPPELPTRAEVLAALSVAIDLGLGQPAEHMLRSALIATRLADRLGLPQAQRDCIYYSTLIMWIGCHADSHEYARWFGDDISVRRSAYLVDWSGLPYQRFLLTNISHGESLLQRLKTISTLYLNARGHISHLIHSHCTSAALLAEKIGLASDVQAAVRCTFERFDGGGLPEGVSGEQIPIEMRVAQVAEMVEVHQREYGTGGAVAMARSVEAASSTRLSWTRSSTTLSRCSPFPRPEMCGRPRYSRRRTVTSSSTSRRSTSCWSRSATSST